MREFKRALASKPSPEAHYALGCIYFQLNRDELAARHLRKAVALDQQYGEAFQLLGMIHRRGGNAELARQAFAEAQLRVRASERTRKRAPGAELLKLRGLFGTGARRNKRLMTGGDRRLADALRKDALKAFLSGNAINR